MNNLLNHTREELRLIRNGEEPDEMQAAVEKCILKIVELFSAEGHSGFSAHYTIGILEKVLRFEPVTPLTGSDEEWVEVRDGTFQNKRCSHVFKNDKDAQAYDINGRVFVDPEGVSYISFESRVPITFPYTPKIEYVHMDKDGKPLS